MAFSDGLYESTSFKKSFADTNAALTPTTTPYSGEAAHSFITTLAIAALNARRIADWKLYHTLDEGNGVLVDEWYAMYHLILPRLQDAMAVWSAEKQPSSLDIAGGHWNIYSEDTDDWVADGGTTLVEITRATDDIAEHLAEKLADDLRVQATSLLEEGGDARDLSRQASISLSLAFVDANPYDGDEDDVWAPVPAEGVLIAAQATIRPKWEWRHP